MAKNSVELPSLEKAAPFLLDSEVDDALKDRLFERFLQFTIGMHYGSRPVKAVAEPTNAKECTKPFLSVNAFLRTDKGNVSWDNMAPRFVDEEYAPGVDRDMLEWNFERFKKEKMLRFKRFFFLLGLFYVREKDMGVWQRYKGEKADSGSKEDSGEWLQLAKEISIGSITRQIRIDGTEYIRTDGMVDFADGTLPFRVEWTCKEFAIAPDPKEEVNAAEATKPHWADIEMKMLSPFSNRKTVIECEVNSDFCEITSTEAHIWEICERNHYSLTRRILWEELGREKEEYARVYACDKRCLNFGDENIVNARAYGDVDDSEVADVHVLEHGHSKEPDFPPHIKVYWAGANGEVRRRLKSEEQVG